MWHVLEPQREHLRRRMAQAFGGSADELAFTRNASEGLQICQFGFDLEPGDEVLTTDQDYPRMVSTFAQRARREGIVLRQFGLPVPAEDDDEIVARFEREITPRTRLILMCHVINLTGQVLPVARVIVDGAHAFAHLDFRLDELDCDYYATSLHKWLSAPHGTGLLYVRSERIPSLWPLMAAAESQDRDIRKFEEIGTHPAANTLAVAEALVFHEALGGRRKLDRLLWLRDAWARPLLAHGRVRLHTSLAPGRAGGIATVEIDGLEPGRLVGWLWREHKILVTPIEHPDFRGVRVSPHVYTTPAEIARFVDAMEQALREGIPA
jgi:selenocysteine lyase/cysteine desulfurase